MEFNQRNYRADEDQTSNSASRQPDGGLFFYMRDKMIEEFGKFIFLNEMPSSLGENKEFEHFAKVSLQPAFKRIPRNILTKETLSSYDASLNDLIQMFDKYDGRVSLTTELWESSDADHFICISCHWIDQRWILQKRIIGCELMEERQSVQDFRIKIVKVLEKFHLKNKVFSICSKNTSTDTKCIKYLSEDLQPILSGMFFHIRCCSYVINVCVQQGMRHLESLINSIREVVKSIKCSSRKNAQFVELCTKKGLKPKDLGLDNLTCWISTYKFLVEAYEYEEILTEIYNENHVANQHLIVKSDWETAKSLIDVLKVFDRANENFSICKMDYVLPEIVSISRVLAKYEKDPLVVHCITDMKKKWIEYFSEIPIVYAIANVLDPFINLSGLSLMLKLHYENLGMEYDVEKYISTCKDTLNALYAHYSSIYEAPASPPCTSPSSPCSYSLALYDKFRREQRKREGLSELDYYLSRRCDYHELNVVQWWSRRDDMYPILWRIVKGLYSSQATVVVSESGLSAGKNRELKLTPDLVRIHVCKKDWDMAELQKESKPNNT